MLTYDTTLQAQPPVSGTQMQSALRGLRIKSPYGYSTQHQDVLNALGDQNAAQYQMQADKANSQFGAQKLNAQRDLALQGLQQMSQARQDAMNLSNAQRGMSYGLVNSLLSGLFH